MYQTVPASTIYQAFEELIQPDQLGFATIRTGFYGKVVSDDIVHIVKLEALKGARYSIRWGISLSYIPHGWQAGLRWHRSLKSARFDVFETPAIRKDDWDDAEEVMADTMHGKTHFMKTLDRMWKIVRPEAMAWLSSVQSLADVLFKTHEQVERKWTGGLHHPNPLLVYALTLGRMGYVDDAVSALNNYFNLGLETPEMQANLKKALEVISPG